jgi:hypothetical protein
MPETGFGAHWKARHTATVVSNDGPCGIGSGGLRPTRQSCAWKYGRTVSESPIREQLAAIRHA